MRRHAILPERPFESYQEYLEASQGSALERARAMGPTEILEVLEASGLRGRGGAGFPAGKKWRTVYEHPADQKFVVCNAAEGEPATFKDRMLLRRNPYAVLEGLAIAAEVMGARVIHVGLKARFGPELEALRRALAEMEAAGVLDRKRLEVLVTLGPDAYLFGEENALMSVLEGGGPLPRLEAEGRPVYEWGLRATATRPNPTLSHNAETLARVPGILLHGAASFREAGSEDTPGLVLYTLWGDLQTPGVYEADPSATLRELFEGPGGGAVAGRELEAALPGVATGVIPAARFGTPAGFGPLDEIGSGLGSAGFMVLDETRSMPAVAEAVVHFLAVESCNQCPPCKDGLRDSALALAKLIEEPGCGLRVLERARRRAKEAPTDNRCALPTQGTRVLESFLEHFEEAFVALAEGRAERPAPFLLPKIDDYLESRGRFVLDTRHLAKNLDWTWEGEPPEDAPRQSPDLVRTLRV